MEPKNSNDQPRKPAAPLRVGDLLRQRQAPKQELKLDDLFKDEKWKDAIPSPKKLRTMIRRFKRTIPKLKVLAEQKNHLPIAKEAQRCLAAYQRVLEQLEELEELKKQHD